MRHLLHHIRPSGKVSRYGSPALIATLALLFALPAQAFPFGPFGRARDERPLEPERPFGDRGGVDFRVGLQFAGMSGFADGGFNGIAWMSGGSYVAGDRGGTRGRDGGEGGHEGREGGPGEGGRHEEGERLSEPAGTAIGTATPVPNHWTVLRLENPLTRLREFRKMRPDPFRRGAKRRESDTLAARNAFMAGFSAPEWRPADPDRIARIDAPPLELRLNL